jgi:hypothetical protein
LGLIGVGLAFIALRQYGHATPLFLFVGYVEGPFSVKIARTSLNLSTYIALYSYGYRNVYELGPLVELNASKLEFESSGGAIGR